MLTADQQNELATTGVTYLRGVLPRHEVGAIEDRVWELFAARGVARDEPSTWPGRGRPTKLQPLRKARVFDAFRTNRVRDFFDDVLGAKQWVEPEAWGPLLVSFPEEGTWKLPGSGWHFDLPAIGDPDQPHALRVFGFVTEVAPHGGGTLVIEGSNTLVARYVAAAPDGNAGQSAKIKKKIAARSEWFRQPTLAPTEIDGITLRIAELTGEPGDVAVMLPWTMHNRSMCVGPSPRFMVTHSVYRVDQRYYPVTKPDAQ